MPERDELLSTLPDDLRDDAERLYEETGGTLDPRDLVAELHKRGLLGADQLTDAVLALEASLKIRRVRARPPEASNPTILGTLGSGAMGEVLLARDEGLNRVVAVKRLLPQMSGSAGLLKRFYKEAQITAQLDHPYIVPIHGLLETEGGGLAYAMKLVRGETLEVYLTECRDAPTAEHALTARLERFLHVCDAVAYAHDRGILHRDLKPENIMLGSFGQVMVMDWGIAKIIGGREEELDGDGGSRKVHGTQVGQVIGTPRYMSPEQAEGRNDVLDARSDQYSLGLVLYEMVCLRPAIKNTLDLDACLMWARAGRKQPVGHVRGERIARELVAIIDQATGLLPDQRYATVEALAEDVRRYLRDEAVFARPDTILQRLGRTIARRRQWVLMALLALLALFVTTGAVGLAGGVSMIEIVRWRASAREAALTGLLQDVAHRAAVIDGELAGFERLLSGASFAAEVTLVRPPGEIDLPYDPVDDPPPNRQRSKRYGTSISVDRPSVGVPNGVNPRDRDIALRVDQLVSMGNSFGRILVDSAGRDDDRMSRRQRQELVEKGVPVVWARVATQDGVMAWVPGSDDLDRSIDDPRKQDWYRAPKGQRGPAWTGPGVDPDGQGLVITGSQPLFDGSGRLAGVAAVDVTLDRLVHLLDPPKGSEAWLVDSKGRVMVHRKLRAHKADDFDPKPLKDAAVREAVRSGASTGWIEPGGGRIAVWSPVRRLGWTYVVVGPAL